MKLLDAFENIVAHYLEEEGYWVRQSVKVNITKEDKGEIGKPSMPRPEIDLVALNMRENILVLVEVKSFLDSQGVRYSGISRDEGYTGRYKLLTSPTYQKILSKRLKEQYLNQGLINEKTTINFALAAGNIYPGEEQMIKDHFLKKGWMLIAPSEIKEKIKLLANKGWEDNEITITAKLIMRDIKTLDQ